MRSRYLLDSCVVQVDPRLNIELEYLAYPENLTEKFSLEVDSSEDGLVIAGMTIQYITTQQNTTKF
jgi:hypothetical protein